MAANYNYVKFQRGTLAAYNNLRVKDPDTLYFIYADANNQYGSLYLGDKLISGGEVSVVSSSLADLSDVNLTNAADGQILSYDATSGKWKNLNLAQAIEDAGIETGAEVTQVTPNDGEDDGQAIDRVITDPEQGDIAFVGDNVYIYNGDSWQQISGASEAELASLQSEVADLKEAVGVPAEGDNPATGLHAVVAEKITATEANQLIAAAVGNLNHLSYQKVDELSDIDTSVSDADRYIYLVPQTPGDLNDLYDEYLVIDGSLEKMGQWGAGTLSELETTVGNLSDIINGVPASGDDPAVPGLVDTVSDLNDIINGIPASGDDPAILGLADRVTILENGVGDLSQLYNYNAQNPTNIVNTINEINERLVWSPIGDSENEPETPEGN